MRIWLVTVGEPLPTDGAERLLRAGILADMLAAKGHEVVFWTSTFDHTKKKQRFNENTEIQYKENYKIIFLKSAAYKSNISISRILSHINSAAQFAKLSLSEKKPDIILASYPTIELCVQAVRYGEKFHVSVVLDSRDMWPDIFLNLAPEFLKPLARLILLPMFSGAKEAFGKADALFGITDGYVDWSLGYAGRKKNDFDSEFPLAYDDKIPDKENIVSAELYWKNLGIVSKSKTFIISFFGTFGRQFELDTVIKAAKILFEEKVDIKFVICGTGESLDYYKEMAADVSNVKFPGWIDLSKIWTLLRLSKAGLAPYKSTSDFTISYPNKSIEYMSAGLPVISSLKGSLEDLLNKYGAGVTYQNNNVYDLIGKIMYLYDNPEIRKKMSKNSLKLYREKFIAKNVYGNMIDHLIEISGNYNKMNNDFYDVTEIPGDDITREQLERNYHRYYWAGSYCKEKTVLEVACGSGQGLGYLSGLAKKFSAGDFSQKLLDIAGSYYGKRIDLKKFDAQKMPFKEKSFDVIIFFEAMYYLPDAEKFVSECRRVLKKNGRLLIATANKDLFDFNPSPYTYKYYGVLELNELLSKYGFETEFFGNSPLSEAGLKQKILRPIKMIAAKTGLIPKTMKGKKLLKRLVFGKMIKMPNEIQAGMMGFIEPLKLDKSMPDVKHKVIYASALLKK